MKTVITFLLGLLLVMEVSAQNPYEIFGHSLESYPTVIESKAFMLYNADTTHACHSLLINQNESVAFLLGKLGDTLHTYKLSLEDRTRWLSVDPLAQKYHSSSPYNYVLSNPLRLIDENGAEVTFASPEDQAFVMQFVDKNNSMYRADFAEKYNQLKNSATIYNYAGFMGPGGENKGGRTNFKDASSGYVEINFNRGHPSFSNPMMGMGEYNSLWEETFHAYDYDMGTMDELYKTGDYNATCLDEAEAWKFSANAPETKMYYTADKDGVKYPTIMYRIMNADPMKVANWFYFGMATAYDKLKNIQYPQLMSNYPQSNGHYGMYGNLMLGTGVDNRTGPSFFELGLLR